MIPSARHIKPFDLLLTYHCEPQEVMNKTPERERRRRHPHELIGPHSDVYSLGKAIENATVLLGLQYENLQHTPFQPATRPKLELVYSPDLWNLIFACQNEDARNRPRLHHLYKETKVRMEYCRALALAEEEEAFCHGNPGCFHSSVLYKRSDRMRFETDAVFRSQYRRANLAPAWDILGPLYAPAPSPPPPAYDDDVRMRSQASFERGDDKLFRANHQDVERALGIKDRKPVPVRYGDGGKIDVKRRNLQQEKMKMKNKKGVARVQQGLKGLLNKMNFFS